MAFRRPFQNKQRPPTIEGSWFFFDSNGNVLLECHDYAEFCNYYNLCNIRQPLYEPKSMPYKSPRSKLNIHSYKKNTKKALPAQVLITIDETGNKGKSLKGDRWFIVAGCVVSDKEAFSRAIEPELAKYHDTIFNPDTGLMENELKFHWDSTINTAEEHEFVRTNVISRSLPFVSRVYYIKVLKPIDHEMDEEVKCELQRDMVKALADKMMDKVKRERFEIIVDQTEDVPSREMEMEIESLAGDDTRKIKCSVHKSMEDRNLMVNDFYVGAIGWDENKEKPKFTNLMRENGLNPKNLDYNFNEDKLIDAVNAKKTMTNNEKQGGTATPTQNSSHLRRKTSSKASQNRR